MHVGVPPAALSGAAAQIPQRRRQRPPLGLFDDVVRGERAVLGGVAERSGPRASRPRPRHGRGAAPREARAGQEGDPGARRRAGQEVGEDDGAE